ncbi:MAG TPA: hypothetical protein PK536_06500 [Ignavibacteria bacterium]|nr:hypothetical protein [Bacteroidota bacterium]HRI85081.1 hypothetical protein [Ignavibacteria bacterium]HRJ98010.1 hypothetical protein [Ignavibacteria bacterium]
MKSEKFITALFVILIQLYISQNCFSQSVQEDLNGGRFKGKLAEETPPDVDRMPQVLDDIFAFQNGKISGEILKKYSVNECSYSAFIDEKRMVAVKVVKFTSECQGSLDGENVNILITGEIYADLWMAGDIVIKMKDKADLKFRISAEAK